MTHKGSGIAPKSEHARMLYGALKSVIDGINNGDMVSESAFNGAIITLKAYEKDTRPLVAGDPVTFTSSRTVLDGMKGVVEDVTPEGKYNILVAGKIVRGIHRTRLSPNN